MLFSHTCLSFSSLPFVLISFFIIIIIRRVATCKQGKPGLTSFSETLTIFSIQFLSFRKMKVQDRQNGPSGLLEKTGWLRASLFFFRRLAVLERVSQPWPDYRRSRLPSPGPIPLSFWFVLYIHLIIFAVFLVSLLASFSLVFSFT